MTITDDYSFGTTATFIDIIDKDSADELEQLLSDEKA